MEKKMKKSYFFLVLFFTLGFSVFAQNRQGLVIDNGVRLRSGPGLDTEIVGKKDKNSVINIYSYSGSGIFKNGILDYWACISENGKVWINAYWITELDFQVKYLHPSDGDVYLTLFSYDQSDDSFKCVYQKEFGNRKEIKIKRTDSYSYTLEYARINMLIKRTDSIISEYEEHNFEIYFNHVEFEIDTTYFELLYGIKVGMKKNELFKIIGNDLYVDYEGRYRCSVNYHDNGIDMFFLFDEDDCINKIVYNNPYGGYIKYEDLL